MSGKEHRTYIDILRILAITLVLYNHTSCYTIAGAYEGHIYWALLLGMGVFCKVAVPLFFMISGALLLGRDESMVQVWKNRILRFALVIIVFSALQYVYAGINDGRPISMRGYIHLLYYGWGNPANTYWYLYAYLGFLVMLPLLRRLVESMKIHEYFYLAILNVVFIGAAPTLYSLYYGKFIPIYTHFSLPLVFSVSVFYPLMGYGIELITKENKLSSKIRRSLVICSLTCIAFSVAATVHEYSSSGKIWYKVAAGDEFYVSRWILIPTVTVYILIKSRFRKCQISPITRRILSEMSGAVFTIMLVENLFRNMWGPFCENLFGGAYKYAAAFVWLILTFICSLTTGIILKHTPGFKKLV